MFYINTKFVQRLRQESCWFALLLFACLACGVAQAQTLSFTPGMVTALTTTDKTTGSSAPNYTGPLSGLILNLPQGLTYDSQGDLFIVDAGANVVRVVASGNGPIPSLPSVAKPVAGTVYTIAGSGSNSPSSTPLCGNGQDERSSIDNRFYGNGCPATDAILYFLTRTNYNPPTQTTAPLGQVALDANGNLYIPDPGDNQVRVVYAGGTVPGLLASLPAGVTPTPGNIYAFAGSAANQSTFNQNEDGSANLPPVGVAVDASGDVYIQLFEENASDSAQSDLAVVYNGGSLPVTLAAQALTTFLQPVDTLTVGGYYLNLLPSNYLQQGEPPWNTPASIALDSSGNIYISDSGDGDEGNSTVYVVYAGGTVPGLSAALQGQAPVVGNAYAFAGSGNLTPAYVPSVPATQANLNTSSFANPTQGTFDPAGDFYVGLSSSGIFGPVNYMTKVDNSGNLTLVAGNLNYDPGTYIQIVCAAAVDGFGDGCPANLVAITGPLGVAMAPDKSIYFSDGYEDPNTYARTYELRRIDGSASALTFPTESAGVASPTQIVTISNADAQPLNITAINIPNNFSQVASGGTDCSVPVTLAPGQSCLLGVQFQAVQAGTFSDNITITSDSSNATSGANSIAVSGTATANSGTSAQKITFTTPSTATYGQTITLNGTASSGLAVIYQASGPGRILGNTLTVTGVGPITVTAYQPGDSGDAGNAAGWAAASPVPATINAQAATLTATADNITQARTLPIPTLTYTITGFANGDTQATTTTGAPTLSTTATATSPSGSYPITIAQGTLATTTNNYTLAFQNGTFTIQSGSPQTITFTQTLPTVTYSTTPISLAGIATATSGLPVTYSVAGPATINGTTVTLTGAGTVIVTANQAGNATYAQASPVTESFTVQPAPLFFTANSLTMAQTSTVPMLTYSVTGFINNDTAASVVGGTPVLTTTATSSSSVGTYPIAIAQGSVTILSTNYTVTSASFVGGTMSVVAGTPQTITFGTLPNVTYGVAQTVLSATASSGLPVTFSVVSGPATITNNVLSVIGAGSVVVAANQGGNATYNAATPAKQSFTVAQAALTITANSFTRLDDVPNPPLTFTVAGLVNGDTAAVFNEQPAISTTATAGSPTGTYPINVGPLGQAGDPVTANNYIITGFVPGTLTITSGGPVQDFTPTLSVPTLTILDGQVGQVTLTVTPLNYYGGIVNLSCTGLPTSASCVFSPAAINASLTQTATLTITTSNAPVVASLPRPGNSISSAAVTGWASLIFGFVLAWQRKRLARFKGVWGIAMAAVLFGGAMGMTACGGSSSSSSNNGLAARGTSTIQVVTADSNGGPTHSIPLVITIK